MKKRVAVLLCCLLAVIGCKLAILLNVYTEVNAAVMGWFLVIVGAVILIVNFIYNTYR